MQKQTGGRTPRRTLSRVGLACIVLLLGSDALSLVLLKLLASTRRVLVVTQLQYTLFYDALLYLVAAPLFLLVLRGLPSYRPPLRPRWQPGPAGLLGAFAVLLGISLFFSFTATLLTRWLPFLGGTTGIISGFLPNFGVYGPMGLLPEVLLRAVLPAVGEELLFRLALHRKLAAAGDRVYMLTSGLVFGLAHSSFAQAISAVPVGMALAWVYLRTQNIAYPMLLHFCNNLLAIAMGRAQSTAAMLAVGALIAVAVIVGAVLLLARVRWLPTLDEPPAEPGWPYKAPRPARHRGRGLHMVAAPLQLPGTLARLLRHTPRTLPPPGFAPHPAWGHGAGAHTPFLTYALCTPPHLPAAAQPALWARQQAAARTAGRGSVWGLLLTSPGLLAYVLLSLVWVLV